MALLAACPGEGNDEGGDETGATGECADPSDPAANRLSVTEDVTGEVTWTCDTIYVLDETVVFVTEGTLTIEAGTTIEGTAGSALVVTDTARIEVNGTADAPVVMTSANAPGSRARGDWGGLVLFGTAPVNLDGGFGVAEGFQIPLNYGGTDAAHDCGALQYLRVEWAGFEISAGNELNGITFYACGSDTRVDHVQVHMGQDDGIEMFGGNFDASYVVITGAGDDSVDIDQGFTGSLTHVFVHQDPAVGDACFEWSNGNDFTAEPLTSPSVVNGTCVGSGADGDGSKGVILKEGTEGTVVDTLFIGLTDEAVRLEHQATQDRAEAGGITFEGTLLCGANTFAVGDEDDAIPMWTAQELEDFVLMTTTNTNGADCRIPSTTWGDPDVQPPSGSPADGSGTSDRGYIGAVDPGGENWTREPWINYAFEG